MELKIKMLKWFEINLRGENARRSILEIYTEMIMIHQSRIEETTKNISTGGGMDKMGKNIMRT